MRVCFVARLAPLLAAAVFARPCEADGASPVDALLEWEAPEGCPDGVALHQSLKDTLGDPVQLGSVSHVRGSIERRPRDWALTLDLVQDGRRRTRLITAQRCEDLADAAALAIQLAVTHSEQASPTLTEPARASKTSAAPLAPTAPPDAKDEAAPAALSSAPPATLEWSVSAAAALDLNALSRVAPGLSVEGRARLERFELGLYAAWLAPASSEVRAGEAVSFGLIAGGPRACYRGLEASAFAGKLCGALELGRFSADGGGLSRDEQSLGQWWLAPGLGLELEARLIPVLALQLRADALRPLVRRRYAVNTAELVYATPEVDTRLYLGLSLTPE